MTVDRARGSSLVETICSKGLDAAARGRARDGLGDEKESVDRVIRNEGACRALVSVVRQLHANAQPLCSQARIGKTAGLKRVPQPDRKL